jgi:error-prone DNA polymerase
MRGPEPAPEPAARRRACSAYAELSCQSAFSFLRGASEPEALVERAAELGYAALALTDRDGLYGNPRFHLAAKAAGLPAVHGTTLTLARPGGRDGRPLAVAALDGRPETADDRVVLLAEDDAGWSRLCRLVSAARHRSRTEPVTALESLAAEAGQAGGLIALAGPHLPEATVAALREIFGRGRMLLAIHDRLLKRDRRGQATQRERGARLGLPPVVTGGVRFARREDKPLHDVLACVRHGLTLDEAATRLLPNAEFCLRPTSELQRLFRHCPDALTRTVEVAARCRFSLDRLAYRFPHVQPPPGETQFSHLHRLVHAGAPRRYRPMTPAAARQLARELDLIERLDLAGYFLLVHDIVRFCEEHEILCQGRGSAANSAVCYVLGITSVDPVGMDLLFERFLSENRGEMPDIDLDIEHERREEVLQYVYGKYGRDHAALAAEVISYRARSAVRDAGKALGFTLAEVDSLAKGLDRRWDNDSGALPPEWTERRDDPRLPHLLRLVQRMEGLPRHLSIHVGGMIITGPPLTDVMPVEPAAMKDRTVVPWDKDDLAALGILKIDLLGLGMLTALAKCFRLVNGLRREGEGAAASGGGYGLGLRPAPDEETASAESMTARGCRVRPTPPPGRAAPSSSAAPVHQSETDGGRRDLPGAEEVDLPDAHGDQGTEPVPRAEPSVGMVSGSGDRGGAQRGAPGGWRGPPMSPVLRGLRDFDRGPDRAIERAEPSPRGSRAESHPGDLSLYTIPTDDTATWDMLCAADTVGVFQVESRAQMNCLPRLKPRRFYDLVVEVALIRPGPIQGGMVHPYLRRRAGREAIEYPHPSLKPILERTLGVPLFQEQGMRIAMTAAGFSGGEADELRRAMGHKRSRERMEAVSRRLIEGMARFGIPRPAAERIYKQLAAFADFGFPESHAASFARLAWASSWLKRHHPTEFLCALLNSQPMGFYPPAVLVSDAQRHGVLVLPVDVLQSGWESTLQWVEAPVAPARARAGAGAQGGGRAAARHPAPRAASDAPDTAIVGVEPRNWASAGGVTHGSSAAGAPRYGDARDARREGRAPVLGVRLGLCTVRGLGEACEARVRAGLASVATRGPFVSPEDVARRCGLERGQMENLARLGALGGFEERRRHALWRVAALAHRAPGPLAEVLPPEGEVRLPRLDAAAIVAENYRMGGISVERHPLELLRARLDAAGVLRAAELLARAAPDRAARPVRPTRGEVAVAGLAVCRQRPPTAGGLTFVSIEDETGFANLIVTPEVALRDRAGLLASLILAVGRLEFADGVVNLRATRLSPLGIGPLDGEAPIDGVPSHDYR